MNGSEKGRKGVIVTVMVITGVLLTSGVLSATLTTAIDSVYAYREKYTQAESLANACGNGQSPFNVLCQNLASEIQGDENAVNIIGTQTGGGAPVVKPPEPKPPEPCTAENPDGDDDGDNLLNIWEICGIDVNSDGMIDLNLPDSNAQHKDLYVEVDFMEFHQPIPQGITDVIASFNNAPVTNPDGISGITLHVLVDEEIPHQATTDIPGLLTIKSTNFGTAAERADPNAANIIAAKELAFHYGLFAHQQPGSGSSGISNGIGAKEFLVTLGAPGWGIDPGTGHTVGSLDQQEGTFMHELGHNLNLRHGGDVNTNCKPNYLSVMSYTRQFSNFIANRPLDYSQSSLATLDESNLNEPNGISASTPPGLTTVYGPVPPGPGFTATGIPVDWNFDGDTNDLGVTSNINGGLACGATAPNEVLTGFDDWNVGFQFQGVALAQEQTNEQVEVFQEEPELTIDDVRQSRLVLLNGIESAIERLQVEPQSMLMEEEFDTSNIATLLMSDQLAEAIAELNILKGDVIETFGEEAAQREVIPMIDNLILALEKQM